MATAPVDLPGALATYLKNARNINQRIGGSIAFNPGNISLPPALAQGATTPLGGRPANFMEGVVNAAKQDNLGGSPVGTTNWDPNAFMRGVQAQANDSVLNTMGKDASPHHSSLMQDFFGALSAPLHSLIGGAEDYSLNAAKGSFNPIHFLQGAKEGISGHGAFANQDWGDLLNYASNRHNVDANLVQDSGSQLEKDMQGLRSGGGWQHALGTAGDFVADPLNFVGVAPIAKLAEAERGVEGVNAARRAISLKAGDKALPLIPLPKKSEIISGISKLPGEGASNLAQGLAHFKDLALDTKKISPAKIAASLPESIDPTAREAVRHNVASQVSDIQNLQAAHPMLTMASKVGTAPSKLLGKFGTGPQGFLGNIARTTALDNEARREVIHDFKGISERDNAQLLSDLKNGGYKALHDGTANAKTILHDNVASVFANHLEQSRQLINEYFKRGGTSENLANELKYLQAPKLEAATAKSEPMFQAWLSDVKGPQDASHLAYSLRNAVDHALAHHDLADMVKSNHGYRIPKATTGENKGKYRIGEKAQAKLDQGMVPIDHPLFRDEAGNPTHLFDPEVATRVHNLFHLIAEPRGKSVDPNNVLSPLLKKYDRATNTYKRAVTVYNPGSHARYLMSSILQMMINGFHNPHNIIRAARVVAHHDPEAKYKMALGHLDPDILRMPDYAKAAKGKGFNVLKSKILGRNMTDQEIWHDMSRYGLTHNFVHAQLSQEGLGESGRLGRFNSKLLKFGETRDNIPRIAQYLDALERAPKGLSEAEAKQWAADQVIKTFHNFSDLSRSERNVMQRLIPFYADIRKNTPMLMKSIVTHPGRVAAYPLGMQELEEGTGGLNQTEDPLYKYLTPDYLLSSGAVPVGYHGSNPVMFNQKNHLTDLLYQLGGQPLSGNPLQKAGQEGGFVARQFGLSTLNPFLRIPAELAAQRQFFSGNPINDRFRYATQQLPLANAVQKIFENRSKQAPDTNPGNPVLSPSVLNYLFGLGTIENSPVQQQAAANSRNIPSKKALQKALPSTKVP